MVASQRQPVVFLPHGGGPWPFVEIGIGSRDEQASLAQYLRALAAVPASPPKALLAVSAHWEQPVVTLMTSPKPPLLFDYYGFPPESYSLEWPAPGAPGLAARVTKLLAAVGIPTATDDERGFDHGTFVPLKLAYPDADVPTLQISLKAGLDPAEHLAIGRALAPLRDEGVFIIGSGMSFHNLRAFGPQSRPDAVAFDDWLVDAVAQPAAHRDARLAEWASAPSARRAHPREEHLIPLMVVAGAAEEDRGSVAFHGTIRELPLSAFHFG